jgi:hypothetical protein
MSAITELTRDLPDDPRFAITEFASRASSYYRELPADFDRDDAVFILRFIDEFVRKYRIHVPLKLPEAVGPSRQAVSVLDQLLKFKETLADERIGTDVAEALTLYSSSHEETFGLARLNEDEKRKILQLIEKIRSTIETSTLSERKKNALLERLTELIREVNTHGTRTDRFFAFAGDVAFVVGDMTKKAKPLLDEVKEVLRIIGRARARQEGISLPPGDEVLRLPSPTDSADSEED